MRRRFTPEFKRDSILRATQPGAVVTHVARELGLDQSVLRRWVQQSTMSRGLTEMLSNANGSATTPVSDFRRQAEARFPAEAPVPDQGDSTELSRLKRELEQLRHERDILIRALGHFTKSLG